jgi:hypothetical protein
MDFSIIIEYFLAGAFPWISQLKQLDFHFKLPSFDLKSIFNFFASLFSISVFIYMDRLDVYDFVYWPNWKLFIGLSFVLTILYFIILIYKRVDVNSNKLKLPIIINFIIYILIFSTLTTGFGLLNIYKDNYVVKGIVIDQNVNPLKEVGVYLHYKNASEDDIITQTDKFGRYYLLIPKTHSDDYNSIDFDKGGYNIRTINFGNLSALKSMSKKVTLNSL